MASIPSVSVVIPVFNRPEAAHRAIASALAQTFGDIEVVVVDDGSAPPFRYEGDDGRVRTIRLVTNAGAAAARNRGVEEARATLIAFLDSDDEWTPEKLRAQLDAFPRLGEETELRAVACGFRHVGEDGNWRERIPRPSADPADFAAGCWFCPGSTVVLPKAAFALVGPFDARLRRLEDLDWFLRFALAGGRLDVVPSVLTVIAHGRRGRPGPVEDAARLMLATIPAPPSILARLADYLDLELAVANLSARRWGAFALTLTRRRFGVLRAARRLRGFWTEAGRG